MLPESLNNRKLWDFLLRVDEFEAERVREEGCRRMHRHATSNNPATRAVGQAARFRSDSQTPLFATTRSA